MLRAPGMLSDALSSTAGGSPIGRISCNHTDSTEDLTTTSLTFRRLDWPGAYSGIVSDNVLDPSTGVVISTFKTAPFDGFFNPPNDGGDAYMNVANLERFYFAEGWGKLRWEYWSTSPPTRNLTGECPTLSTWEVVPSLFRVPSLRIVAPGLRSSPTLVDGQFRIMDGDGPDIWLFKFSASVCRRRRARRGSAPRSRHLRDAIFAVLERDKALSIVEHTFRSCKTVENPGAGHLPLEPEPRPRPRLPCLLAYHLEWHMRLRTESSALRPGIGESPLK